jgi:hypothetical protein
MIMNNKKYLILMILLLCGCERKRHVNAITIPNEQPITVKVEEPGRLMERFEEILFYTVIIISFVATIFQTIRFEINKYKNNNDINRLEQDLRNITVIIGERNLMKRQQELRQEREFINNLNNNRKLYNNIVRNNESNSSNSKTYDSDNNIINDGELESLIPSGSNQKD